MNKLINLLAVVVSSAAAAGFCFIIARLQPAIVEAVTEVMVTGRPGISLAEVAQAVCLMGLLGCLVVAGRALRNLWVLGRQPRPQAIRRPV